MLPLKPGFNQENFLGMNAPDYGGGTPVVDVWCRDVGIGVGHVEMAPKLVSLPVTQPRPGPGDRGGGVQARSGAEARRHAEDFSHVRRRPPWRLLSNAARLP